MSNASTAGISPARTVVPAISPTQRGQLASCRWVNQSRPFEDGEEVAHYKGAKLGRITGQRITTLFTTTRLEYEVTFEDPEWPGGWRRYCLPCELVTAEQWRGIVGPKGPAVEGN